MLIECWLETHRTCITRISRFRGHGETPSIGTPMQANTPAGKVGLLKIQAWRGHPALLLPAVRASDSDDEGISTVS